MRTALPRTLINLAVASACCMLGSAYAQEQNQTDATQSTGASAAGAQAAGSSRVHWLTQETNYPGRQLYDRIAERSGFIQYRKQF